MAMRQATLGIKHLFIEIVSKIKNLHNFPNTEPTSLQSQCCILIWNTTVVRQICYMRQKLMVGPKQGVTLVRNIVPGEKLKNSLNFMRDNSVMSTCEVIIKKNLS